MNNTFDKYAEALRSAGPGLKELILRRAEQDGDITFGELQALCKIAYPEDE